MKPEVIMWFLLISITATVTNAQVPIELECPAGWTHEDFGCYWLVPNLMPWASAERLCKSYGGHLAVPKDFFENEKVGKIADDMSIDEFWTGAERIDISTTNQVDLNSNLGHVITTAAGRWDLYQPDFENMAKCVYVMRDKDGDKDGLHKWNFGPCERKLASMCMRNVCPKDTLSCTNGKCVSKQTMCDGEDDCGDGSDERDCSNRCSYSFKNDQGRIDYPTTGNYSNNVFCSWFIEVPVGTNVEIEVESLHLEDGLDYLVISGGGLTMRASKEIVRLTGFSSTSRKFYSSNNMALIQFFSDSSISHPGFIISYSAASAGLNPRNHLVASNSPKVLESPFYLLHQMGNQDYTFIISAENSLGPVTLEIKELDLAEDSTVLIRDGDMVFDGLLATLKGSYKRNGFVVSSRKDMYITMQSINGRVGGGFVFHYWQGCSYTIVASTGYITSPGYPVSRYPNFLKCKTTVQIPNDAKVSLYIDRVDVKSQDKLKLISKGQVIREITDVLSRVESIEGGEFEVEFSTSFVGIAGGFNISFSIDCPPLDLNNPETTFGAFVHSTLSATAYKQRYQVSCNRGSAFAQVEHLDKSIVVLSCEAYGVWNVRTSPRCERIYCPLPPNVDNGFVSAVNGGLNFGGSITYECEPGFTIQGQATVTCNLDKAWSALPTCQSTDCGSLPLVSQATKTIKNGEEGKYGSIAEFTCNEGYDLIGSPILYCVSGVWQGTVPSCSLHICYTDEIESATLTGGQYVNAGQTITVQCHSGFEITRGIQSDTMTCQNDGFFDKILSCQNINECDTGEHNCEQICTDTVGSHICSCRPGYQKIGTACENINECEISNGNCDHGCDDDDPGYHCTCDNGYVLFDSNGQEGHLLRQGETGQREGDKYRINHSCVPVKCSPPPDRRFAVSLQNQNQYHYRDTVAYQCLVGYRYANSDAGYTLTCGSDRTWSGTTAECVLQTCPIPSPSGLLNPGTVSPATGSIPFKESIFITCQRPGFQPPTFVRTRQCTLFDGQYMLDGSDADHECGFIDCGSPQMPGITIGSLGTTYYQDTFTFACQSATSQITGGSTRYDNTTVTCLETGQWDFGSLSCPDITCPDPGRPDNGRQVDPDYRDQRSVSFACDIDGYVLDNLTPITCIVNNDGTTQYDRSVPNCVDRQKPEITNCPSTTINVAIYTSLNNVIPDLRYQDNGGIMSVTVSPAWPTGDIYVNDVNVPVVIDYRVTDYANNFETCTITVLALDKTAPTFDCPSTMQRTFSENEKLTVDFDKNMLSRLSDDVDSWNDIDVTFSPDSYTFDATTMLSTSFPPVHDTTITVVARDQADNAKSCTFGVHFQADVCSPYYLRTPLNSFKDCVAEGSGYKCTITCNSGYVLYDDPDQTSTTTVCAGPAAPFPPNSIKCVLLDINLEGNFKLSVRYTYEPKLTTAALSGCDYTQVVEAGLNTINALNLFGFENCEINARAIKDSISLNEANRELVVEFSLRYDRTPGENYRACALIQVAFVRDPKQYLDSIYELKPSDCPAFVFKSVEETYNDYYCTSSQPNDLVVSNGVGYCLLCSEGTYQDGTRCEPCAIGQYNPLSNQPRCIDCDDNTSTYEQGSVLKSECYALCSPGTYSASGLSPCKNCPKDTYWINPTTCMPCDNNKITRQVGATSDSQCLSKCPEGTFNPIDGHAPCSSCPKNHFSNSQGATSCTECQPDSYTDGFGSTSSSDCHALAGSNTCTSSSCPHGRCQRVVNHVMSCICNDGWTGQNCNIPLSKCASRPCLNNGQCTENDDTYSCTCGVFTSGDRCEKIESSCSDDYCNGGGVCENTPAGPQCHCFPQYSGNRCQITSDICGSSPCINNGGCTSIDNVNYVCNCAAGWTGRNCEQSFDDCYTHPCYNFGTCVDKHVSTECDCSPAIGYEGSSCNLRISPCSQVSCGLGTCVPDFVKRTFSCRCDPGTKKEEEGTSMERCVSRPFCDSDPCLNGGNCNNVNRLCDCTPGYTGTHCQHVKDNCVGHLCRNGGKCINVPTQTYTCDCSGTGFEGQFCQNFIDHCASHDCDATGFLSCMNAIVDFKCVCKDGFTGSRCQINIDDCRFGPCLHEGVCTDLVNDYQCNCPAGWSGKNCQTMDRFCNANTCQNGASCFDVFKTHFCECLPNTFGQNCEDSTDVCLVAKPCVRGQCGTDAEGVVTCTCPFGFVGDRCQHRMDYCMTDGTCQNSGTCLAELDDFDCDCMKGFSGTRCLTDINYCQNGNCPSNSACIDMEDRHYCRCDLRIEGLDCNKGWVQDWDFRFDHPHDIAHAYLPYPIQLNSPQFAVNLRVQFSKKDGRGTFFSLFTVPKANSLRGKMELLIIDHSKISLHVNGITYEIKHRQSYDDGAWHYLVVNIDGIKGQASVILDTVQSSPVAIPPGTTFNYNIWPELGCKLDTTTDECVKGAGFQGMLTRVAIYSSVLDFEAVTNSHIDTVYPDPILLWSASEYMHSLGVSRLAPSMVEIGCPFGYTNAPDCDQMRPGKNVIHIIGGQCPKDIIKSNKERLTEVSWEQPTFNGETTVSSLISGSVFVWGKYSSIIESRNQDGNAAVCLFHIYVQDEGCTKPDTPVNVINLHYTYGNVYSKAATNCISGYATSIASPNIHSCGPTGEWNPLEPFMPYRISPCGGTTIPLNNLRLDLDFVIPSDRCERVSAALKVEIMESLKTVNNAWDSICNDASCSNVEIEMDCSTTEPKTFLTGMIHLLKVKSDLVLRTDGNVQSLITDVFQYLILAKEDNIFDYTKVVFDAIPTGHRFDLKQTCIEPKVLLQGQCVDCGPGTFYDNSTALCHFCPIGFYNPISAQYKCIKCRDGLTTAQVGAVRDLECKNACNAGYYFDVEQNECKQCKRGFYQPEMGKFFCLPCSAKTTTRLEGSTSQSECSNNCPPGHQIGQSPSNPCEPCPIGYFRTTEPVCEQCPPDRVTSTTGARKLSDCNVANNQAGTRRLGDGLQFEPCPFNYYQPEPYQSFCIHCGENYRTEQTGSKVKSQCRYSCPAGEQQIDGKDDCEKCPIGTYRDGTNYFDNCRLCHGNFVTRITGAHHESQCDLFNCGPGEEPNDANGNCNYCPRGEYQPLESQTKCLTCPPGKYTKDEGSDKEDDCVSFCPPGEVREDDGTCTKCPLGSYKDNDKDLLGACQPCPPKFTTQFIGTASMDLCNVLDCQAGDYADNMEKICKPCPKGTFQSQKHQSSCEDCSDGRSTRNQGSDTSLDCEIFCPSGEMKVGGICSPCERGFYKDNNVDKFMDCTPCDEDLITPSTHAKSKAECSVPNCSSGTYIDGNKCYKCPIGTYQDEKWKEECKPCGEHKTTKEVGTTDIAECYLSCPEGKENLANTDVCEDCKPGYYKSIPGIDPCKACVPNLEANGIRIANIRGAKRLADCVDLVCSPGYEPMGSECQPCEYGFYQPDKWQDHCEECAPGRTTYLKGADSALKCWRDCPKGHQYDVGNDICLPCPIGYFNDDSDPAMHECTKCRDGVITSDEGAGSVSECVIPDCSTPGTFQDGSQCEDCPFGTYQDTPRQTSCKSCNPGYTTQFVKSTDFNDCKIDCPPGTELNEISLRCDPCVKGKYRSKDTWTCQDCPTDLTTLTSRSTSKASCSVSTCGLGTVYKEQNGGCHKCPLNTYQDLPGQVGNCKDCPNGKTTVGYGRTAISDCLGVCDVPTRCAENVTCIVKDTNANAYDCICTLPYIEENNGCIHACDADYCGIKGTCQRNPFGCICKDDFDGERCTERPNSETVSAQLDRDTVIGVVTAGGFLLFMILLITLCVTRFRRNNRKQSNNSNYDDLQSIGTKSDMPNFGMKPSNSIISPTPAVSNGMYYTPFGGQDPAVYTA